MWVGVLCVCMVASVFCDFPTVLTLVVISLMAERPRTWRISGFARRNEKDSVVAYTHQPRSFLTYVHIHFYIHIF